MSLSDATKLPLLRFGEALRQRRHLPSLSLRLGWRNLAQDRIRLATTLAGVSFSVLLMSLQIAILLGFVITSASLVDRTDADFWIAAPGARDVDQSGDIATRNRFPAVAVPGVASVGQLALRFVPWTKPDGGTEVVIIVGVDLDQRALRPWNMVSGTVDDLHRPDGIIIDTLYAQKLGIKALGDVVEISGHRARVVGLTHGIRTFTQAPYVFTSIENAKVYAGIRPENATYLLVKARSDADRAAVHQELLRKFPHLDVWTSSAFSRQTSRYWLESTGAGAALVLAAALGLIVGAITVAQTLYAATMERISEYATMRAMGAPARYLYGVILKQALLSAALGYAIGIGCAETVVSISEDSNVALLLPLWLALSVGVLTAAMCAGAAAISIRRAVKAEPAMVFK